MGRLHLRYLDGRIYTCNYCQAHLALVEDVVSKARKGISFLQSSHLKKDSAFELTSCEERMMITGLHTVSDIFCIGCGSIVGWKYEVAPDKTQKYKEGKVKVVDFEGANFWVSSEAQVGGSDADDAGGD